MTKVCVATSYTETFSQLGDLSAKTLRFYANRHSCAARIISNLGNVGRPAAWHRVQWIPELLDEGFDFVFWLDADALFLRFDRDVRELIQEGKDLYMVRHAYDGKVVPNTGVMLVRNCAWSRRFFSSMWNCNQYIYHRWWENAAAMSLLGYRSLLEDGEDMHNQELLNHVSFVGTEWNALPYLCTVPDPIVHHYAGEPLERRLEGMTNDFLRASRNMKRAWPLLHWFRW
jgi:hypothetical protein